MLQSVSRFASHVLRINPTVGTSELIGPEFTIPDPQELAKEFGDSIGLGDGEPDDEHWGKWMDGVLSPNGNLYCQPWCANRILQINTNTGEVDLIGPDLGWMPDKYRAAVAIYCPPFSASRVLRVDLTSGDISLIGPDYGMKRGNLVNTILCPPHSATQVLQINIFYRTCALVGRDFGEDEAKYRAIVQSNDGCFYGPPCNAPQVICIDPIAPDADFIGRSQFCGSSSIHCCDCPAGPEFCAGGFKWVTAGLGEDGCVYSPPWLAHKALRIDVPNRAGLGGTNLPGVLLSRSQGWARQIGKNHGWGGGKWDTMCAHEDGFFYCPPLCATDTLSLDTAIGTTELLAPELGKVSKKWRCAARSLNGDLFCPPYGHEKAWFLIALVEPQRFQLNLTSAGSETHLQKPAAGQS
eukprot:symbB.v1.2.036852.t1/scaffold5302.1/size28584/1